jgi:hypothetical protein
MRENRNKMKEEMDREKLDSTTKIAESFVKPLDKD